ncbi:hypothetical protein GCM10011507_33080 [Edaphobacter acidisoli]|uniref:NolW-like domain-containing protein n=1 Tax=Edaphobacter acidisoli TaxID=2040573 RepID=A0A916WA07_9BACT|nr:secretin N-terminal domain-containing protein [Edaphobacter acidisoli]GGA79229.1 hypothetical protein GCM10011507_33080 [Edaphobacter acidisoli]
MKRSIGGKMKFIAGVLGIAVALAFGTARLRAQESRAAVSHENETTQTFYLSNVSNTREGNEIVTALRNLITPQSKIYSVPTQNAIIVRSTPDQLVLAQKLINDLDRPNKTYRLTYTLTEMDNGKRVGTQHYSLIVVSGERTTLKQGSKVPIATGTYKLSDASSQTQITYVDLGMNFDVTLDEFANGVRLRSKVEESSVAEQTSNTTLQDPIIRQTVLEGSAFLTSGKPLILGSLDIPGSTRHMDVDVEMDPVQ